MPSSDTSQHSNTSNAAERFSQICTLLLQSQQHNCVQDAATFSRLLCISKQLQDSLLYSAIGCIQAKVPRCCSSAKTDSSMVHWLVRHMQLGTIRHVEIEADGFYPDLYVLLSEQLHKLQVHGATAAAYVPALPQAQQQQLLQGYCSSTNAAHAQQQSAQQQPVSYQDASGLEPAADGDQRQDSVSVSSNARMTLPHCTASLSSRDMRRRLPSIFVSWHVCGLPPSLLPHIPGATLTHLTLRDSTLTPSTVNHLATLTTLRQIHLPNLNPGPVSQARALSALTALTSLFIRDPQQQEQQALPVSLQRLTVAQRTPPWVDAAPDLAPLQIGHLTRLTSLTVHEWLPQGITEQYRLPGSLQQLAAVCIGSARPLLRLKKLHCLQLSSLKHTSPSQLLQLSSLPALTAVQIGSENPESGSGPAVRLCFDDLRAYAQVFAAVPVVMTALVVQQHAAAGDIGSCGESVAALGCLKGLKTLNLEGQPDSFFRRSAQQHAEAVGPVPPNEFVGALAALSELTELRLSCLQLPAMPADNAGSSSSSSSSGSGSGSGVSASGCDLGWAAGLQRLAQLRSLRKLVLRDLPLGAVAIQLTAMRQLHRLELHDCGVSAGVVGAVLSVLGPPCSGVSVKACSRVQAGSVDRHPEGGGCLTCLVSSQH